MRYIFVIVYIFVNSSVIYIFWEGVRGKGVRSLGI